MFFCKGFLISILTQSYSISIVFNSSRSLVMMKIGISPKIVIMLYVWRRELSELLISFYEILSKILKRPGFSRSKVSITAGVLDSKITRGSLDWIGKNGPQKQSWQFHFHEIFRMIGLRNDVLTIICSILIQMNFQNVASLITRVYKSNYSITRYSKNNIFIDIE